MPELIVFNIRKAKYADALIASGASNRWNKKEEFVIYTGSSRALSVLELLVHRAYIEIDDSFRIMIISLKVKKEDIQEIKVEDLPLGWQSIRAYEFLQEMGSRWYRDAGHLVLKVPSAIIPREFNYLINTRHPEFNQKVKIKEVEEFRWDERLI